MTKESVGLGTGEGRKDEGGVVWGLWGFWELWKISEHFVTGKGVF